MFSHSTLFGLPGPFADTAVAMTCPRVKTFASWVLRGDLKRLGINLRRENSRPRGDGGEWSSGSPGSAPVKISVMADHRWKVERPSTEEVPHIVERGPTELNTDGRGRLNFSRPDGFWMTYHLYSFSVPGWPARVFVIRPVDFGGRVELVDRHGSDWAEVDILCPPPGLRLPFQTPRFSDHHHVGDILDAVMACGERVDLNECGLTLIMLAAHGMASGDVSATVWNRARRRVGKRVAFSEDKTVDDHRPKTARLILRV